MCCWAQGSEDSVEGAAVARAVREVQAALASAGVGCRDGAGLSEATGRVEVYVLARVEDLRRLALGPAQGRAASVVTFSVT